MLDSIQPLYYSKVAYLQQRKSNIILLRIGNHSVKQEIIWLNVSVHKLGFMQRVHTKKDIVEQGKNILE
jgi:hypothetical protein